jgi:hypothetical protein
MGEWLLSRRDTPGTSCLATIMLSLWDEDIRRAEALIKLALTRVYRGLVKNKRCGLKGLEMRLASKDPFVV